MYFRRRTGIGDGEDGVRRCKMGWPTLGAWSRHLAGLRRLHKCRADDDVASCPLSLCSLRERTHFGLTFGELSLARLDKETLD